MINWIKKAIKINFVSKVAKSFISSKFSKLSLENDCLLLEKKFETKTKKNSLCSVIISEFKASQNQVTLLLHRHIKLYFFGFDLYC